MGVYNFMVLKQCYFLFFGNRHYYCGKDKSFDCPCNYFQIPGFGSEHQEPKSENTFYSFELPKPKKRYL